MPDEHPLPPIVDAETWHAAIASLRVKEKAATRTLDKLSAMRRRLPIVRVEHTYTFKGDEGDLSLLDLFANRRQLIVYHFMFAPDWKAPCPGCSRRLDDVGHLDHLHARNTAFVAVASAPFRRLRALRRRKGWLTPFYSSAPAFKVDMGVCVVDEEDFGLSVFIRDDAGSVYRSYFTNGRGVEPAGFRQLLDLTPYGRQEDWEDSPSGWPQPPTHGWGSERDE